jgi:hypothetical protein
MEAGGSGKKSAKRDEQDDATSETADKPAVKNGDGGDAARRKRLRWGVVGLAVLVALIAWIATRGGGESSSEPATAEPAPPRIVTEDELKEATLELRQPIYWVGPVPGSELVLRELERGAQVTYLPEGAAADEDSTQALTIGSYRLADPEEAVEGYAERRGSETRKGAGGTEVVVSEAVPTSVYFASPDNSVQVEVYDPSPKRARNLALSGKVKPVE